MIRSSLLIVPCMRDFIIYIFQTDYNDYQSIMLVACYECTVYAQCQMVKCYNIRCMYIYVCVQSGPWDTKLIKNSQQCIESIMIWLKIGIFSAYFKIYIIIVPQCSVVLTGDVLEASDRHFVGFSFDFCFSPRLLLIDASFVLNNN